MTDRKYSMVIIASVLLLLLLIARSLGHRRLQINIQETTCPRYFNHQLIGSCAFTADVVDQIQTVYPCFALFSRGQKLSVDFKARPPMSSETAKQGPE